MRTRAGIVFGLVVAWASGAGCSTSGGGPERSPFEREFQRYLSLPHQKAFAVAGDPEGRFVFGYGYGWKAPGLARDDALEQCNVRRRSLGEAAE